MYLHPSARVLLTSLVTAICLVSVGCGGGGMRSTVTPPPQKTLTQISITPNNSAIEKGKNIQLKAMASYSDGSKQDLTGAATWKSSQAAVASVSASGVLTAMGVGTAQVSAQYQSVTGAASVTVQPPTLLAITLNPSASSLPIGESVQLAATATWSDGSSQDITQQAIWNSSGTTFATVGTTGSVVANAVGTAAISASSGSLTGSATITVLPAALVALKIIPRTLSLALGSSQQLQAMATLSDGSNQDMTGLVTWTSAQATIASISSGGRAIAERVGSTNITARAAGFTASAKVSVIALSSVNYFDLAGAAQAGTADTIRLTNTGLTGAELCSMIYVFDQNQELTECCGCTVSDSGLRTLSLVQDLTSNPLTGTKPPRGVIRLVPSDPASNPQCDPGSLAPAGVVLGWGSNTQKLSDGTFQVTESQFERVPLTDGEKSSLANLCSSVQRLGSGKGICSCGSGD